MLVGVRLLFCSIAMWGSHQTATSMKYTYGFGFDSMNSMAHQSNSTSWRVGESYPEWKLALQVRHAGWKVIAWHLLFLSKNSLSKKPPISVHMHMASVILCRVFGFVHIALWKFIWAQLSANWLSKIRPPSCCWERLGMVVVGVSFVVFWS